MSSVSLPDQDDNGIIKVAVVPREEHEDVYVQRLRELPLIRPLSMPSERFSQRFHQWFGMKPESPRPLATDIQPSSPLSPFQLEPVPFQDILIPLHKHVHTWMQKVDQQQRHLLQRIRRADELGVRVAKATKAALSQVQAVADRKVQVEALARQTRQIKLLTTNILQQLQELNQHISPQHRLKHLADRWPALDHLSHPTPPHSTPTTTTATTTLDALTGSITTTTQDNVTAQPQASISSVHSVAAVDRLRGLVDSSAQDPVYPLRSLSERFFRNFNTKDN